MHFECTCSNYSQKFSTKKTTKENVRYFSLGFFEEDQPLRCQLRLPVGLSGTRPTLAEAALNAMLVAVLCLKVLLSLENYIN
jgi:hypothetical protein